MRTAEAVLGDVIIICLTEQNDEVYVFSYMWVKVELIHS